MKDGAPKGRGGARPHEQRGGSVEPHPVPSGRGRQIAVVASGDAAIAVGGEWGTLSEIALARNLGRTVVALRSWSVDS